ncbi:hypothetical protein EI94DRAFT_1719416 [Lactarius quietus]|nr:hypothetical protein EI94DRAFT_1719416 [Lactarius quietus]
MHTPSLIVLTTLAPQPSRRAAAWPSKRASPKVKRAPQEWSPPAPHPSPGHYAKRSEKEQNVLGGDGTRVIVDTSHEDQKDQGWRGEGRCPESLTACPVRGAYDIDDFECVDLWADLSSCGGCPAYDVVHDCSSIAHARSVECVAGHCEVRLCNDGYIVAPQHNECVPTHGATRDPTT